jgi:hypothetical protein
VNEADRQEIATLIKERVEIHIQRMAAILVQHIESQEKINKGIIEQLNEIAGSHEKILKGFQDLNEVIQHITADLTAILSADLVKARDRARKAGATEPKKQKPTGTRKKREAT